MSHRSRRRLFGHRPLRLVVAVALVVTACSSDDAATGEDAPSPTGGAPTAEGWVYPGDEWETVPAASKGFDPTALGRLAEQAEAGKSSCLVVTRDGVVVGEHYWDGADAETPRETNAMTMAVTSALVGIAQDDGDLTLADSASDYIPAWRDTPAAAVTVEDLVSNDSGREWGLITDYSDMPNAPDTTAFAVALGQPDPPGKAWAYNNSAIQTLDDVLSTATGQEPKDLAAERIFEPIGMSRSEMTTDPSGNTLTFTGLQTTCLDLARFGYLFLRGGVWDGEQIVSSDYVEAATGRPSTDLNAAYGYLWWRNQKGIRLAAASIAVHGGKAEEESQMIEGAPEDVFWALAQANQTVAVIPSEGIVAVRLGAYPGEDTPFGQGELTLGVLDALVD